ncbi:kinase-like protein [Aspergillus caelatus]|uniref:Kinase-like protein n=1 Tax=Aspergillus caelatus TaxID=61420 RepID=A0A5N7AIG5_9EURO|nr:kinase-like protein [Aspergillus caelatus]KAE8369664.1 kinase-like protein [Aspergillus caelatus]
MDDDLFAEHFKLDVTIQGDISRQTTFTSDPRLGIRQRKTKTIWRKGRELYDDKVYVESTTAGDVRVVKKVLQKKETLRNILSELRVMGRLSKENGLFVQLIGWFQSNNYICFAMEYCPLGDITQCFEDPLSEVDARNIGCQVLEGLTKLHEIRIMHRDIKPKNILVQQRHPIWVKISDFGISKRVIDGETEARTQHGTLGYMAPEVLFGPLDDEAESSAYTSAVDIWSLGCLLHYLLTKEPPFKKLDELNRYKAGKAFPEEELSAHDIETSGRRLIKDLVVLEPEKRPAAADIDIMACWKIVNPARAISMPGTPCTGQTNGTKVNQPPMRVEKPHQEDSMDYYSLELWHAINNPSTSIARVTAILEQGASANKFLKGLTALHLAVQHGSPAQVELLLEYGADANVKSRPYADTPLHLSTEQRDIRIMELLIDWNADVNAQNADGDTTLHLAIVKGCNLAIIDLLLNKGALVDIIGRRGMTGLQYAIYLDQEDKVRLLLKNCDLNHGDEEGRTALHYAVRSSRTSLDSIQLLVEAGADVLKEGHNSRTPLHEAVQGKRREVISFLVERATDYANRYPELEKDVKRALAPNVPLTHKLSWGFGR